MITIVRRPKLRGGFEASAKNQRAQIADLVLRNEAAGRLGKAASCTQG